jgi:phage gpG-like protein
MKMINVQLDVKSVQDALKNVVKSVSSDRILEGVGDIVRDGIQDDDGIFANEGIIGGSGVQSVLWQKSKAAIKEKRKTLNKTGTLQGSIHRTDAQNGTVTVGTNAPYGVYHQFGTKKLPERPFIAIDKKTQERILNFVKSQV